MDSFGSRADAAISRSERLFKKLTPALSGAAKEFLAFASTAAITAAIVSGISFSSKSLIDYQDSVAKFRTIVSDLSDKDFAKFQNKINSVAADTKESSITVANSFEMIAGLNAKLAETADGLGTVSKAAITLSQASKDELGKSASNLVGILNQFNLQADQANRVINVLAAGQAVGASSIIETADAFTVFGAVADASNLSLEQSTALTEVLASKQIKGAEAGTALRGTLIKLKAAGLGYTSGLFNTRDALAELKTKFDKLHTAKEKDALIDKVFGTINATTGTILLNNIGLYDTFTKKVTGTSEAQKAAEINNNTLSKSLERLSNKWVNLITGSERVSAGVDMFTTAVIFLTDHMEGIITTGAVILGFFAGWKALLIGSKIAMAAYNIAYGINNAIQKRSLFYTQGNTYAKTADLIATKAITAAQWLWNAAMSANPIALIVIGIALLVAGVVLAIKYWNEWGAAATAVFAIFMPWLSLIISLIQSFRRNWDMITKAFKEGGVLAGIKAIGATLLDAVLMPLQQILEIIAKVTGADWASAAAKDLQSFREKIGVNVTTDESGQPLEKAAVDPVAAKQDALVQKMESTNNAKVDINVNDPNGRTTASSDNNKVNISTSSTMQFGK
ncbi:MAG: phage tail tape measure protein [Cytophagaceae bacterium]|nr:phage tail tape measure protein [Cytophagaceae bacterium]